MRTGVGTRALSASMQTGESRIQYLEPLERGNVRVRRVFTVLVPLACMMACTAVAQSVTAPLEIAADAPAIVHPAPVAPAPAEIDAPQPQPTVLDLDVDSVASSDAVPVDQPGGYEVAPLHRKYIMPDMRAQRITAGDKVIIGLKGAYSLQNFGGIFLAAGYQQLRNGQPNYGTDRGAFGERLGAAGIRGTTEGVFTDSVFAPLLHEDPRYYVEGKQYGVFHRALYALTRPVVTRTDSGRRTINGAQLLGYASATALNNAFYPSINRNLRDNAESFGGSMGGSALSFLLVEFTASMWHALHIGR
jgi:hypothetical protein